MKYVPLKHKDTKLHQGAIENNRDNDFDPIPAELYEISKKTKIIRWRDPGGKWIPPVDFGWNLLYKFQLHRFNVRAGIKTGKIGTAGDRLSLIVSAVPFYFE